MIGDKVIATHNETVVPDVKVLAEQLRLTTKKLLKEMDRQVDTACGILHRAEDGGDPDSELDARLCWNAFQDLQNALQDAHGWAKYLLGDIDAAGKLVLHENGRFRLPATNGRDDDYWEFTCGGSIEVWNEKEQRWVYGHVEYADKYPHGYYFTSTKVGLQPGIRARHRHVSLWE